MWRTGTFSFFDSGVFLANIFPRWLDTISSAPLAQNMASCVLLCDTGSETWV